MKKYTFIILIIFLASCNSTPSTITTVSEESTPEVLDNSSYDLSILSKRGQKDIITALYEEALEKDADLKNPNDRIENISLQKNDSLADYFKYIHTNNRYWNSTANYIGSIQDSTLKNEISKHFKDLETAYLQRMENYFQMIENINEKEITKNDKSILIKLLVTESMIKNYQLNKKPNLTDLKKVNQSYEDLLKDMDSFFN